MSVRGATTQSADCRGGGWWLLREQKWQCVLKDGQGLDKQKEQWGAVWAKVWGEGHTLSLWASTCQQFSLHFIEGTIRASSSFTLCTVILGESPLLFLFSNQHLMTNYAHFPLQWRKSCTKTAGWENISTMRIKANDHLSKGGNYPAKWDHLHQQGEREGPAGLVKVVKNVPHFFTV